MSQLLLFPEMGTRDFVSINKEYALESAVQLIEDCIIGFDDWNEYYKTDELYRIINKLKELKKDD